MKQFHLIHRMYRLGFKLVMQQVFKYGPIFADILLKISFRNLKTFL